MNNLPEQVSAVSPLDTAIDGSPKKRKPKRKSRNGPVEIEQVDPRVLKEALRIAKGDASRLKIISPRRIEVW